MNMLFVLGPEDPASCRKWDLKNVASVASNPTSFSSTSPCMAQKKNIDSSFAPPCPMTDILPPKHQNVVELKSVLNNVFCGADTYAQVRKQTSEDCGTQTHTSNNPTPVGGQCTEEIHVTDQVSLWQSSDVGQAPDSDNWGDFSEMRLPRCLSPLPSEAGEITDISTQDLLRPLEFSSCLSASHVNLQPTLRYMFSPVQPQAHPGETIQQNLSCTPQHVNEIHCSGVGKNSCPLRSNRDHNGGSSEYKSKEKKRKMPDFKNDLRKGTEDKMLDRQMNESVVRSVSTTAHSVESDNEPYRKKEKVNYPNDTQAEKIVDPCSAKINIRQIDNVQDISNPVTFEKMDCLKTAKTRNTVPMDQKSHENMVLCQISPPFKCKGQEACQKDVWDTKQPASLVTKHGLGMPVQKRTCTKAQMEDLSKISELSSSAPVLNASSSCSHHDLQITQMSKESMPRHGNRRPSNVQHPLGFAQNITKIKDVFNECEKNNLPEPEKKNLFTEPKKVTPDVNLNREENKQPEMFASLAKKKGCSEKISHLDPSITQHFPVNQQQSVLQTSRRQPPKSEHLSAELMMDNNIQKKKGKGVPRTDKPDMLNKSEVENVDSKNRADSEQDESSSRNVNGCLVNGNFEREAEISVNTGLSIHEVVDLNAASRLCTIPTVNDFNNHFRMENHLQLESSTTLLCPFRPETMMEKPKVDEQITESLCEVSNKPTEDKLIKTKELPSEGTGTQIGNLEGQEGEKKENAVRRTEHVEISRMNDNEAEISDIDIDVVDESLQLVTDHGDEVIATAGNVGDNENQIVMDNDGQALAHEEELNGQQVLRTEVEVMPPDEGNFSFLILILYKSSIVSSSSEL